MRRWLVPAFFLAIACSTGVRAADTWIAFAEHPSARHLLLALYGSLRTAVALAFAVFTVGRPEPRRRSREPVAFVACAIAMVAIAIVEAPAASTPAGVLIVGELVAVTGCVWLLASVLTLGRCFGVLPEARGLVVSGPYRVVRHPVYLGEIVALVGLAIAAPVGWNLVVLSLFLGAQVVRTRFEERALSDAFPDYAAYAEQTGRLMPRLALRPRPALGRKAPAITGVK